MNELQKVELGILQTFARVAERENLAWFIMYGTLLGAVRQKGFIPWDDDIDIAMPRADYDKLRLSDGWFSAPYFLQTPHNDPAAAPRYMKLRRSDTAVIPAGFPTTYTRGGNMGVCIDILPLDDVPDGYTTRKIHAAAEQTHRQMYASAALDECGEMAVPDWKELNCCAMGGIAGSYEFFADRHERICSQYTDTRYYAIPVLRGERGCRVFEKEWFSESVEMEFEGLAVPAPTDRKSVIISSFPYGSFEPEDRYKTASHTKDCVVNMNRSYKEYVRRYTDMLCGTEGKKVYIFGAGDSLRIWMERYSQGLDVRCAFDNSEKKWGKKAYGVVVHNPAELPGLLDNNSRLIIASLYHKEISKQLEDMGINDYYIFIDGWNYGR